MPFCSRLALERCPDHTTACQFHRLPAHHGLDAALLSEAIADCTQLEDRAYAGDDWRRVQTTTG